MKAKTHVEIQAAGKAVCRRRSEDQRSDSEIDLPTARTTSHGTWEPHFTPIFKADGELKASATYYASVELALGIGRLLKY